MDARRSDSIVKRMATTTDRRRLVARLGGLTLGSMVGVVASPVLVRLGGKPKPKDGKVKVGKALRAQGKIKGGGKFEGVVLDLVVSVEDGTATLSGTLKGTATKNGKTYRVVEPFVDEPIGDIGTEQTAEPVGRIGAQQTEGTCTVGYITVDGTVTIALLGLHLVLTDLTILLEGDESEGVLGVLLCALAGGGTATPVP